MQSVVVEFELTTHAVQRWWQLTGKSESEAVRAVMAAEQFDRGKIWNECPNVKHNTVTVYDVEHNIAFLLRPSSTGVGLQVFNCWRLSDMALESPPVRPGRRWLPRNRKIKGPADFIPGRQFARRT